MANVLITGGSGLVGRRLTTALLARGYAVRWLGRHPDAHDPVPCFHWDIAAGTVDARALAAVDHIVHLSGAPIADKRWTPARMKELYASRGGAARLLLKAAREQGVRPRSFISASGIGYYGAVTSEHLCTESDPPGADTIAQLTLDWEQAAEAWTSLCRVVELRTAVVLAREGGALPRLAAPARWGLGAAFGNGRQWMPWIHVDDLVAAYVLAVEDDRLHGAFNACAPEQVTNADLVQAVCRTLHRPFWPVGVPAFVLRLLLGEMSDALLHGSRASCERLRAAGLRFGHPSLGEALRATLP